MISSVKEVGYEIEFQGETCLAVYTSPENCRVFRKSDNAELSVTEDDKLAIHAQVDQGAPCVSLKVQD